MCFLCMFIIGQKKFMLLCSILHFIDQFHILIQQLHIISYRSNNNVCFFLNKEMLLKVDACEVRDKGFHNNCAWWLALVV